MHCGTNLFVGEAFRLPAGKCAEIRKILCECVEFSVFALDLLKIPVRYAGRHIGRPYGGIRTADPISGNSRDKKYAEAKGL